MLALARELARSPWLALALALVLGSGCEANESKPRVALRQVPSAAVASATASAPITMPSTASARPTSSAEPSQEPAQKPAFTVEQPRCQRDDPRCYPQTHAGGDYLDDLEESTVADRPYPYRPHGKRYALSAEPQADELACEHDGECLVAGCRDCVSHLRVPAPRPCALRASSEDIGTFCGCVQEQCRWFKQRLTQRVVARKENVVVRLGGTSTRDPKWLAGAEELLGVEELLVQCYDPRRHLLPARHTFEVSLSNKYGSLDTRLTGVHRSIRKCVTDVFHSLELAPNWMGEHYSVHGDVRFAGAVYVQMAWLP
jgi:hypothetical protein